MVPQKEASPFLNKKIEELELKLADIEDGDDDIEDMDDEEAPVTPSMPQIPTPHASDMETQPYTPSQVPWHLKKPKSNVQRLKPPATNIKTYTHTHNQLDFLTCTFVCFFMKSTPKVKGLSKKEGAKRKINMSGYILFSSEMRAVIKARHPDFSFGELSRLVGTEWRNLETTKKAEYEGESKSWFGMRDLLMWALVKTSNLFCYLFCRTCSENSGAPRARQTTPEASIP